MSNLMFFAAAFFLVYRKALSVVGTADEVTSGQLRTSGGLLKNKKYRNVHAFRLLEYLPISVFAAVIDVFTTPKAITAPASAHHPIPWMKP